MYTSFRARLFSKSSLAWLQEFWNSSICLYEIKKKNLSKSTCPTGSFTCPGLSGSGKRRALVILHWWVKSLWPSDGRWWQRSESTLVQVMFFCLTAPSHYLNQRWQIISEVLLTFILVQFHKRCLNHQSLKSVWKLNSKISFKFPRSQRVNGKWKVKLVVKMSGRRNEEKRKHARNKMGNVGERGRREEKKLFVFDFCSN